MTKLKVGIIDYGIGNLSSIKGILSKLGFSFIISSDHLALKESDLILLPGVGAFKPAMESIKQNGLDNFIYEMVNNQKPIIGICLGMQLLGRSSNEGGYHEGLNLISEDVFHFEDHSCHIGWNDTIIVRKDNLFDITSDCELYFNHSYAFKSNLENTVAETEYKKQKFSSIIRKGKIVGLQFHPEKSQTSGLILLKNIILGLCNYA